MTKTEVEQQKQEAKEAAETTQKAPKKTRKEPSTSIVLDVSTFASEAVDKSLKKIVDAIGKSVVETGNPPNAKFLMDLANWIDGKNDDEEDDEDAFESFADFLLNLL